MWFFVAACFVALSLLPLGSGGHDPYPWGACSVLWLIAAAATVPGVIRINTVEGLTFNRAQGLALQWRSRFGRRRETRLPLKPYDTVFVTTWLQKHDRTGNISRWYALE